MSRACLPHVLETRKETLVLLNFAILIAMARFVDILLAFSSETQSDSCCYNSFWHMSGRENRVNPHAVALGRGVGRGRGG